LQAVAVASTAAEALSLEECHLAFTDNPREEVCEEEETSIGVPCCHGAKVMAEAMAARVLSGPIVGGSVTFRCGLHHAAPGYNLTQQNTWEEDEQNAYGFASAHA
jgi:hypothetical protein